ncbi:MAG: NAD(+) synthase [Peptococcaceae bacterium]|jgi:NAD+ synthase (glutamine-hydrolysing)|nr:NAD(+) synthase [Peptococcaceae bacterium]
MFDGYIRVAAGTPEIRAAHCEHNARRIIELMRRASRENAGLLCLPELCVTGYTCGDLFLQRTLLDEAREALRLLIQESADHPLVVVAGLPVEHQSKLYNAAAVVCEGKLLGLVPKSFIPNYGEFYELRHFVPAGGELSAFRFDGEEVPFGVKLLFQSARIPEFKLGVEICEDLWTPAPPSSFHAMAGATVVANLSASDETVGKAAYRRTLAAGQSARLICGYVYADSGYGESSSDLVFSGHDLVCENGVVLAESKPFKEGWAVSEVDLRAMLHDRRRLNTFSYRADGYVTAEFDGGPAAAGISALTRYVDPHPFVPGDEGEKEARCEDILAMQVSGLAKRLDHTGCKTAAVGISGGLDSCLALLVVARAYARLGKPLEDIWAVTMPCFGTTERTRNNAHRLCRALGVTCREIDITKAVRQHLEDIGHSEENRDVVYENAQARVRTLVLMDLANQADGIVVGTGDLSELALGWATYNGDHMSMYGVNAGVPKTLVRHIVKHVADTCGISALEPVLLDILATPVSPELLPPSHGDISQQTERLVGPYELHDFFLYHALRWGRAPGAILELAETAFGGVYEREEILKWLRVFYRRFFAQQFKRNCLPDGPKIGSVSLSPRGDWRMPSDAAAEAWLEEIVPGRL